MSALEIDVFWSFRSPWSYLATPRLRALQAESDDGKPRTADEQPYIARLTRLGIVASEQGRGIEFADEISKAIWTGHENWHEGDHLARATERAGLNLAAMDALVESDTDRLEAMIAKNQEDHTRAGHWGVPTCAFQGEPFFGQDRLEVLVWRLKKAGLKVRSNVRA